MLRFISSLFAAPRPRHEAVDEQLLERATERVVAGSDPRLRALPGYRRRLRPFVENAVTHIINVVNALPEATEISRGAFRTDPRLRAFFVSADHLQQALGGCPLLRDYLPAAKGALPDEIFGLLSMERTEKRVLGMALRGDTIQRDVARVAVNFGDHRYLGPSESEADTRREVMRRAFDFLIEKALQNIVAARSRKAELEQQHQLLQRKLKAMAAGNWGLEPMFTATGSEPPDPAALEAEIEAIQSRLIGLGSSSNVLEQSLEHIGETLGRPAHWLALRNVSLELDQMSIKRDASTVGSAYKLELTEVFSGSGERRTVLLGRIPLPDLPSRPDFLKEAERLLS